MGFVFLQRRLIGFRETVRSVNSVAFGRKGSATRGNDGFVKHVLTVIQVRERSKTTA